MSMSQPLGDPSVPFSITPGAADEAGCGADPDRHLLDQPRRDLGECLVQVCVQGAWGNYRITIHPFTTTETYGRGGFFIHGGDQLGSAGCIDPPFPWTDLSRIFAGNWEKSRLSDPCNRQLRNGPMTSRLHQLIKVFFVIIVATDVYVSYQALSEAFGAGPPYFSRTTNMDKWSDPTSFVVLLNLISLTLLAGLYFLRRGLLAKRQPANEPKESR